MSNPLTLWFLCFERMATGSDALTLKVLFVIGRLGQGGSERQMILLARGLRAKGHDARILCLHGPGVLDDEARRQGVPVVLAGSDRRSFFRSTWRYLRYVHSFEPNVIHPYLPEPNGRVMATKLLTRRAKVVLGIRASDVDQRLFSKSSRVLFPLVAFVSRWADVCIANSKAGAEFHIGKGYRRDRMRVVSNGVDTAVFRPDPSARESWRAAHGFKSSDRVVGLLGRFDPLKRHDFFVRVAGILAKSNQEAFFVICGSMSDHDRTGLLDLAQREGAGNRLTIIGPTDRPAEFLNGIDVLAITSLSEGSPNVLLEAQACGTPVVSTDVGDVRALALPEDRVVGVDDLEGFARALIEVRIVTHRQRSTAFRDLYEDLVRETERLLLQVVNQPKTSA